MSEISWEERLLHKCWKFRGKFLPHMGKLRWSPQDKEMNAHAMSWLVRIILAMCLIFAILIAGAIVRSCSTPSEVEEIGKELMLINPQLDPLVCPVIAKEVVGACHALSLDSKLFVSILKYESRLRLRAKNPKSGAEGLTQWLVSDQKLEELNLREYEKVHIKISIWQGAKALRDGYDRSKNRAVKDALFYYNGVVKNVASGNEYVANVLSFYYDITHR